MKSFASHAAAVLAMGASAIGLGGNNMGSDVVTRPAPKRRLKPGEIEQSTDYKGFPSRQVYRAEQRKARKGR